MTAWYVRPDTSHSATRDGTTYATAWGGWSEIVWGASGVYGVNDDTLYVCGAHAYAAIIAVGAHLGTAAHRATIRGDYAADLGSITFSAGTYNLTCARNYTTISNLRINAGDYGCIVLGNVALTGVWILNNYLNASGASTGGLLRMQSFDTWNYVNTVIDNNDFVGGSGSVGGGGITWWATSTTAVTFVNNIKISNNRFTRVSAARAVIVLIASTGLPSDTPSGCKLLDVQVYGNTFANCFAATMEIYANISGRNTGVRICDNVIRDQSEIGGLGGGIVLGGFAQSLTSGFGSNIVTRNQAYELYGISGFVNLFYGTYRVFNNFADGIGTSTIDGNGVLFDHGCDNCEAFCNEFHNIRGTGAEGYYSGGFGILVLDATNCKAYGNVVDGCVTGVAFGNKDGGQSANVFNNSFLNCSQAGAYLVGGAEITNNLVRNNIFTATRSAASAVKNSAAAWTGESGNCYHGFGSTQGHTLHASTTDVDPELDADYRPRCATLKRAGTYFGGKDFSGKPFYNPPNIGAVDDVTTTPRYALIHK
ncbi:hypothetical protein SAMN05216428_102367 [Nitrosospira sp. Nsp11]|uniref:hypothetical protein n=1 Tax=Nitrosospira sp. Nsp11 TaxID=1855338 RepID=UPI00091EC20F|nr:hypothetical protein [Nitrosospira sp. Nsp11]SHL42594.1 hypothetical protein SAMN05216428_102367 [Nitrosospira sp. Nsp11]